MEPKVGIISWKSQASDEPASWYRLDEPGAGDRFFADLIRNSEMDGRDTFELLTVTKADWKKTTINVRGEDYERT